MLKKQSGEALLGMGSLNNLPFQSPSSVDFFYLALVAILILIAYCMSRLKGNLGFFGSCGLAFFPAYSIAGYLFFLLIKGLGIVPALIGATCLILFLPFFVMSFSLFFENGSERKCFALPKKAKNFILPSIYSLLFLGAFFGFFYLVFLSITAH